MDRPQKFKVLFYVIQCCEGTTKWGLQFKRQEKDKLDCSLVRLKFSFPFIL